MKVLRLTLLMFMTFVLLLMLGFPGLYDSKRRFDSRKHYYSAQRQHELARSTETQKEVEVARQAVVEANRLDRQDIMIFETFMLGVLGVSGYVFIRAGKSVQKISTT